MYSQLLTHLTHYRHLARHYIKPQRAELAFDAPNPHLHPRNVRLASVDREQRVPHLGRIIFGLIILCF